MTWPRYWMKQKYLRSSGQHCAILSTEHLGAREAGGTVRASFHYYNTLEDIKVLGDCLEEISNFGR